MSSTATKLLRERAGHRGHATWMVGEWKGLRCADGDELPSEDLARLQFLYQSLSKKLEILEQLDVDIMAEIEAADGGLEDEILDTSAFMDDVLVEATLLKKYVSQQTASSNRSMSLRATSVSAANSASANMTTSSGVAMTMSTSSQSGGNGACSTPSATFVSSSASSSMRPSSIVVPVSASAPATVPASASLSESTVPSPARVSSTVTTSQFQYALTSQAVPYAVGSREP